MKDQIKKKNNVLGNKTRVLIVDDDPRTRRMMEAFLIPSGYEIVQAVDGEEALDIVEDVSPDVILLDVMMPKLSGLEVAMRLKKNVKTRIIPVVIVTALDNVEARVKAFEMGADDFLSKPVEKTELRARVKSLAKIKAYNENLQNYQKTLEKEVERKTRQLRKALKKIEASLQEKEVMLREIHHRVKNNFQIIISLLRLQARDIKDAKMKELCKTSYNRIMSMALIHEILYRSKDLARIDFSEYINRMAIHLYSAYNDKVSNIDLKIETDNIYLDVNKAIPCALITSELLTNAIKHAFPGPRSGIIHIKVHKEKKGRCSEIISDNGVGLPSNIDCENPKTLGFQLVNDLIRQIGGTLEVDRRDGTTFKMIWDE